jgi:Flp pilus assembly secretin CpaC
MSGALAQSTTDVVQPTPDPETDVPPFERMIAGQVRIIKTAIPYSDVLVGASEIADISPMSDQKIAITAKNAFIEAFNGRFRAECLNQH